MNISRRLPQFVGKLSLFVVTGERDAVFYVVQDGTIEQVDRFVVTGPRYSDREGVYFAASANGRAVRTGSVKEIEHKKKRGEFLRELQAHVTRLSRMPISDVYVFAPATILRFVEQVLLRNLRKHVQQLTAGNYVASHPFQLLQKARPSV